MTPSSQNLQFLGLNLFLPLLLWAIVMLYMCILCISKSANKAKLLIFCIASLGSDPRTATVDLKGLTHISFGVVFVGCLVELKNTRDSETPNLSKASSTAPSNSASVSTRYSNQIADLDNAAKFKEVGGFIHGHSMGLRAGFLHSRTDSFLSSFSSNRD